MRPHSRARVAKSSHCKTALPISKPNIVLR
jgi:hypothetical protein